MSDAERRQEVAGVTGEQAFTILAFMLGSRSVGQLLDTSEATKMPGVEGQLVEIEGLGAVVQVGSDSVDFSLGEAMWRIDKDAAHDIIQIVAAFEQNPQM